ESRAGGARQRVGHADAGEGAEGGVVHPGSSVKLSSPTTDLISTIALKWMEKRPFSKEARARRQARRAQRRAEREARRKGVELSSEAIEYEVTEGDMGLLEKIGNLRTSTKGGAVGLIPGAVMFLPFAEPVNDYIMQACQAEGGPLPFLVGAGVTWVAFYVAARKSKTPEKPGAL